MATNTYEWKKINRILTDCKFCSAQGKGRGQRGVTQFGKCKQQQRPTVRQQLVYPPPLAPLTVINQCGATKDNVSG